MTDLLATLPDFSTAAYTHLLPSFEKNGITVADLLTLDPIEIVKRCPLPLLDVRRFVNEVIGALQEDAGIRDVPTTTGGERFAPQEQDEANGPVQAFRQKMSSWSAISTLDDTLDTAIGGGIPTGYVTEVTGERY
jgi:DNA repair protein RAD57